MKLIKRDELVALISEWKNDELGGSVTNKTNRKNTVIVKSDDDLHLGDPIQITGPATSYQNESQAVSSYLTYGVVLAGKKVSDNSEPIGITAMPVKKGRCARVYFPEVYAARITSGTGDYATINVSGVFCADSAGEYRIIYRIGGFAYIYKSDFHGVFTGHITERHDTVYTFSDGDKEIECYAPLLRDGEYLEIGTSVIITKSKDNWVVIAAQCPEDD